MSINRRAVYQEISNTDRASGSRLTDYEPVLYTTGCKPVLHNTGWKSHLQKNSAWVITLLLLPSLCLAQNQTNKPAQLTSQQTASKSKAADMEPLPATVIEVHGSVQWARPGVSVLKNEGWNPVKWKDQLTAGTQIRTGLKSWVHLQFGKTTVVALRSATHASLDQLYRSATTEHIKIGLGYGTVRGGSVEGKIRSKVTVDSTVATLAKRGTEGWEMNVEPGTGRFRISLAQHGLVEAIRKLRGTGRNSRSVRPGEYVTDINIANMWISQDIFDHNVQFYQADSVTVADLEFTNTNPSGLGVINPGGGLAIANSAGRMNSDFVIQQIQQNFASNMLPPTVVIVPDSNRRREGDFGTTDTFKILLPVSQKRSGIASHRRSIRFRPGR